MAGLLEEGALGQDRSMNAHAAIGSGDLAGQPLELVTDRRAGGQPQRQPGADDRVAREEVQVAAEIAVIRSGRVVRMCSRGR